MDTPYWEDVEGGGAVEMGSHGFDEAGGPPKPRWVTFNQRGEPVLTMAGWGMLGRRTGP